ncbi:spondin domain-containing protein [Gilvibacter sediminis]|uniref:T9SS type A sorting domain-containing protein n=1 Tax=Gilvibacter sediminis TaxID=379071 RepID=UPI0023506AF9|nr:spondin domain-containing protein [Gilvibacter sediminis]MDC7999219.1 spondin domain-containing protein [Gilvibacter sediminis]
MQKITLLLLLLIAPLLGLAQSTAQYSVTFESTWSQATHPHSSGSLPATAHWSRLVGATHNDNVTFFEVGGLATAGIEDVAESGNNTVFFTEVADAIADNYANQEINGPALATAAGSVSIDLIETTSDYPLLTLVSMVAPSPDWIIGVNSLSLLDSEGAWIEEITVVLYPYDAGTDSGLDYTAPNMDTDPQEPISNIQGVVPFSSEPLGTLTISLEGILSVDDNSLQSISMSPNPATDHLNLQVPNADVEIVSVYSALGQLVYQQNMNGRTNLTMDLSNFKSGVYLVNMLTADGQTVVRKLVKR